MKDWEFLNIIRELDIIFIKVYPHNDKEKNIYNTYE